MVTAVKNAMLDHLNQMQAKINASYAVVVHSRMQPVRGSAKNVERVVTALHKRLELAMVDLHHVRLGHLTV